MDKALAEEVARREVRRLAFMEERDGTGDALAFAPTLLRLALWVLGLGIVGIFLVSVAYTVQ